MICDSSALPPETIATTFNSFLFFVHDSGKRPFKTGAAAAAPAGSTIQSVFSINHSWWVKKSLNIELMREAAKVLTGVHDFSTFRSVNCSSKNTIKNLREILITNNRSNFPFVQLEFEANSFLQHMVRILTGTLVEIGLGRKNIKNLERILKSGQRNLAGITAPSHGLYSLSVIYPKEMIEWPIEVIDN